MEKIGATKLDWSYCWSRDRGRKVGQNWPYTGHITIRPLYDQLSRCGVTLASHLNCVCDELAKDAVNEAASAINEAGVMEIEITGNLPLELASLYIGDNKQTSDVAKE